MTSITGETPLTQPATADRAYYKILIEAPIETVWNMLVKTDEVLPFFFGAVCRTPNGLAPGEPMAMQSKDGRYTSVVGKVIAFDPPHRYAHSMMFTNLQDPPSTVTYELKPVDGGTEFTLITENVPAGTKSEKSMAQGGPFIIGNLKAMIEAGRPLMSGRMVMMLGPVMGLLTPKISRSENWSFERIRGL